MVVGMNRVTLLDQPLFDREHRDLDDKLWVYMGNQETYSSFMLPLIMGTALNSPFVSNLWGESGIRSPSIEGANEKLR